MPRLPRSLASWLAPLLLAACKAPIVHAPAAGSTQADPIAATPLATDAELELDLVLGWPGPPPSPTAVANEHNRRGLALHRAEQFEEALIAFDEAITADPTYAWARYNRACALVRLARFEPALVELDRVLREDLPRFGPQTRTDGDLQALRESPDHKDAFARMQTQIAAAYRAASLSNVTAWSYTPRPEPDPISAPYTNLRMGTYEPQQRRFIPLSPALPRALAGLIDPAAERLLIVSGTVVSGDMFVVQPVDIGVYLYDLSALGEPINHNAHVDRQAEQTRDIRYGVSAAIEADIVRLTYHDLGYAEGDATLIVVNGNPRDFVRTWDVTPDEPIVGGEDPHHIGPHQRHVLIDGFGIQTHIPAPPGLSLSRRLAIEGLEHPIELAWAHRRDRGTSQRIERTPDGRFVLVLSQHADCGHPDPENDGELRRFAVSRVDIEAGAATLLIQGIGIVGVALGHDGSVFIEDREGARRFAPGSSEAIADVPAGVHFAIPESSYDCSI